MPDASPFLGNITADQAAAALDLYKAVGTLLLAEGGLRGGEWVLAHSDEIAALCAAYNWMTRAWHLSTDTDPRQEGEPRI